MMHILDPFSHTLDARTAAVITYTGVEFSMHTPAPSIQARRELTSLLLHIIEQTLLHACHVYQVVAISTSALTMVTHPSIPQKPAKVRQTAQEPGQGPVPGPGPCRGRGLQPLGTARRAPWLTGQRQRVLAMAQCRCSAGAVRWPLRRAADTAPGCSGSLAAVQHA